MKSEWLKYCPCSLRVNLRQLLEQAENAVFIPWACPFNLETIPNLRELKEAEFNETF